MKKTQGIIAALLVLVVLALSGCAGQNASGYDPYQDYE
jgi:predicted small secreted protein